MSPASRKNRGIHCINRALYDIATIAKKFPGRPQRHCPLQPHCPLWQSPPPKNNKVSYRVLGKTGLKVTTVGFGSMITSDPTVITRALDMGITYYDTARGYQHGNCERMLGAALKGRRKDIVLSSKSEAKTAADATADLETSLKELGTDYLDIWYIHSRDNPAQVPDELVPAWIKAKEQGKIRHIGLSTHIRTIWWTASSKSAKLKSCSQPITSPWGIRATPPSSG